MTVSATPAPEAAAGSRRTVFVRIAIGAAALGLLVLVGRQLASAVPAFQGWVGGLGGWGPVAFVAGYAVAVVAFVPGSLLTLAGGATFGLFRGVAYVWLAATLGAGLAFLVARYLARPWVEQRVAADPRFAAIDGAIASQGGRIVFLLRLSPLFPFSLLNYALGLTRVRFRDYMIASLGMLPGTVLYVYYGSLAGELAQAAGGTTARGPADWGLLGLGLVATLLVTRIVTRLAGRALHEATGPDAAVEGVRS